MAKTVMSWGTFMCDIIASGLGKVAEPGVIEYLEQPIELRLGGHPVDFTIDLAQVGVDQSQIGFVSTIGNDVFGDFLLQQIGRFEFESFVQRADVGTGKTMILSVQGADRLCHLDPGACMHMSLDHLEAALKETAPAFFTFRPGYTNLDTQIGDLLRKLRRGPLADSFLLLDICAPYGKGWDFYLPLLEHVDAVHGNSKEIMRAAGKADLAEATESILSHGVGAVLLTKADEGAELVTDRYRLAQGPFRIDFREPSGCGDAFCAGVIWSLMQSDRKIGKMDADELAGVLVRGQAMGAAAATEIGCVDGVTGSAVQSLIADQGDLLSSETSIQKL